MHFVKTVTGGVSRVIASDGSASRVSSPIARAVNPVSSLSQLRKWQETLFEIRQGLPPLQPSSGVISDSTGVFIRPLTEVRSLCYGICIRRKETLEERETFSNNKLYHTTFHELFIHT